jgi:membrane protein DedA with SNARE-associated domain
VPIRPVVHPSLLSVLSQAATSPNIIGTLQNILHLLGYPAVVLFVMIESSGIPFPGETMLLLASFYAAVDQQLQIPLVIACAAAGAIIGDNIGYQVGRTGGKTIVKKYGHYLGIKPQHLERAEKFFARYGDKTVFFGRFVAVLRAWAAFLAGINQMDRRKFFMYNAAGGILWAAIYGSLGYFAGRILHDNFGEVERVAGMVTWILGGIIIAGAATAIIVFYRRKRRM